MIPAVMERHIIDTVTSLRRRLSADGVQLVAVSKFHPADAITAAYSAGQRDFGESRATELAGKAASLPADIRWHFIGHLQTNKVRLIMPYVSMIQSVDSERLLRLIDAEAHRIGRTVDILLQLHVAAEETRQDSHPTRSQPCSVHCRPETSQQSECAESWAWHQIPTTPTASAPTSKPYTRHSATSAPYRSLPDSRSTPSAWA